MFISGYNVELVDMMSVWRACGRVPATSGTWRRALMPSD